MHVTIEPEDTNCPCCRAPMHVIGEESSERLDVIPAQFRVIVTHRPKYACRACEEAVVQAPAPERLIKGGLPTEAMVASVLVAKYAWHLPLYRQAQMLAAQGLDIKRSVLAFWVGYAAAELKPLYLRLRELILTLGQDRGRRDDGAGARSRPRPHQEGLLLGDRPRRPAVGRDRSAGRSPTPTRPVAARSTRSSCSTAIAASCNATAMPPTRTIADHGARRGDHARLLLGASAPPVLRHRQGRRCADRQRSARTHRRALCDREDDPRHERRRAPRGAPGARASRSSWRSRPGSSNSSRASPRKAPIAEEIRYGLNHWDGLTRFLDDGRIELDTNIVERGIRPIVLNRKNALFAGHDEGAENWACIASLIETCKLNGVDPQAYFADVLTKLVNLWPASRIDELMPWAWGAANRITVIGAGRRMMADPITVWSSFRHALAGGAETVMSPLELDGYLTGIVVTPQAAPILPSAWMARLWGDDEPIFEDEAQINTVLGAVMIHYNTLLRDIDRSLERLEADRIVDYRPLFLSGDQKPAHDAVRTWVRGFWKAMELAPDTWSALVEDDRTKIIIAPFVGFFDIEDFEPHEIPATSTTGSMRTPP